MITEELIEATYLFCYKRLQNNQDAEDLSQTILCEALKAINSNKIITHFYSWFWKMAHNQYATFLALRNGQSVMLESYESVVAISGVMEENLINKEEYAELNYAISRLGAIHREIIILFYLKGYSISDISIKLNVPIGTVKGRLFDARKNLKERLETMNNTGKFSYAPSKLWWFGGYNAHEHKETMNNLINQQILILCREQSKTIIQLADEMGVAPIYLETSLRDLIERRLLKQCGKGRYLSDICIFPQQVYIDTQTMVQKVFWSKDIVKKVIDILYKIKDDILACDYYGKHLAYEDLMWIFIVYAGGSLAQHANEIYKKKYAGKVSPDNGKDYRITATFMNNSEEVDYSKSQEGKSVNWSNMHHYIATSDFGVVEYINDFQHAPFPERDEWINPNNISLILNLMNNPSLELSTHAEEMVANLIKNGILKRKDEKLEIQIPILKKNDAAKIHGMIHKAVLPLAKEVEEEVSKSVERLLLPYVREDLLEEFVNWNMCVFLQPTQAVFYYAIYEANILKVADRFDNSAAGLWMVLLEQ